MTFQHDCTCRIHDSGPLRVNRRGGEGARGRYGLQYAGGDRRFADSPIRRFALAAFAALASCALMAQTPAPAPAPEVQVLTLEQALAFADAQNRDVQKAEAYRQWVQGKYLEERAAAMPQLALDATVRRDSDQTMSAMTGGLFPSEQDTRNANVSLNQVLFAWGKVGAAIRAAKSGIATADELLVASRQAARRDVTAAFYDVLLAKELVDIARQNLQQKERHLDEARKKYALGTATDYDVLSAEVAVQNARPALIRAENDVRVARLQLQVLLGRESGEVDAQGSLEVTQAAPPEYTQALAEAWQNRPDVKSQVHRVEVYEELKKIARAGDKPRLDLTANYAHSWLTFGNYNVDGPIWNAGVYLKVPLFDGLRTKGQVMEAQSDLTTARIDLSKLRDQTAVQVRGAVDAVRESGEILDATAGNETQAERLLQMAEKGYELGVKTQLDVDDAALSLRQSQLNLARARRDLLVAQTNLKWTTGTLGE